MKNNNFNEGLALILVAAGSSSRFSGGKKEYLQLNGGTVLSSAADVFLETKKFDFLVVTYPFSSNSDELLENERLSKNALFASKKIVDATKNGLNVLFVPGGSSRQNSVLNALKSLESEQKMSSDSIVFIHDGARPFIKSETIEECFCAASEYGASVPGLQPTDTQKEIDKNGFIVKHLVRSNLCAIQTPQVFNFKKILEGHKRAFEKNVECTDDTEIWDDFVVPFEENTNRVKVVKGDVDNKKITFRSDYFGEKMDIRTGLGYDKHVLVEGRKLMLGGIEIPSEKGEDGHSDGDVLLHAITDALLGASCLGDIGSYFPPSDPKWKDADSKMLLSTVWADVQKCGWRVGNLDCVIALEKPKFLPHRDSVRQSIANILGCDVNQVFVKAKTGEKIGDVGEGHVVEVWATCLLTR